MISYYFASNAADVEEAFKQASIPLEGKLQGYVDDIVDYLAKEYNSPFSYFLGFTDVKSLVNAFEDAVDAQEFVDNILSEKMLADANILIYGDKKIHS